jgi:hypothetical protein
MMHVPTQFTPAQLLESGRRAETEGRLDLAVQFYRHLTDNFAYTAEAAEAHNALGRVGAAQSQIWQPVNAVHVNGNGNGAYANGNGHANGVHAAPAAEPALRAARSTRTSRRRPVAPRNHYRTGRTMARIFSGLGWVIVALGIMLPLLYLVPDTPLRMFGLPYVIAGAIGVAFTGFLVVFSGQIARAMFDQANATRDLAAMERAKLVAE